MSLDQKYNIPRETIKNMVSDGVISGTVLRKHEICDAFFKIKRENPSLSVKQIILNLSVETNLSVSYVEKIVYPCAKSYA